MVQTVSAHMGWELALAVFPVMCRIHRSYRLYFGALAETPGMQVLVRAAGAARSNQFGTFTSWLAVTTAATFPFLFVEEISAGSAITSVNPSSDAPAREYGKP